LRSRYNADFAATLSIRASFTKSDIMSGGENIGLVPP
jgi:hypothetical protein